jgi:AIG2-like family
MLRKVMTTLHYFAYGSNLHPIRLQERVPSAKVLGVVKATGRQLMFSKRGKDLSGKCNFYETGNQQDIVYGVLYEFDVNEKSNLDKAEGKGLGYNEKIVSFTLNGLSYSPFTYVADSEYIDGSLMPYEWYKQFVIVGAQFHAMPLEYVAWLASITAIPDPDANRNAANLDRLNTMKEFNKAVLPPSSPLAD